MNIRVLPACLAIAMIVLAGPALAADKNLQKVPANGVTFKKKAGYWTECRYDGLGTVCETVYARVKNGSFKPVTVANSKLTKKAQSYQVCYWGSNNAEICYWVYSPRKAP